MTIDTVTAYLRRGFAVVHIPPRQKFPTHENWNRPGGYFTESTAALAHWTAHPRDNLGVVLEPSQLCSLDADQLEYTQRVLAEPGLELDALIKNYPTIQGHPERRRITFRVPTGVALARKTLVWPGQNGTKETTVFELRAGLVQDVWPPSIHPDTGQPYRWITPLPKGNLPELPTELLELWQHWEAYKDSLIEVCPPWATPKEKPSPKRSTEGVSVIAAFNQGHSVARLLEQHGYQRKGKRWLAPSSSTKLPGVVVKDGRVYSHHGSDRLADGYAHDAFDVYRILEHDGNFKEAVKAAAKLLGMEYKKASTQSNADGSKPDGAVPQQKPPPDYSPDIIYRPLSEIKAQPLEWLWRPYLLRRALTLIVGDNDVGKSKVLASVIAITTQGDVFPMTHTRASGGKVVLLSAEEDAATMLKPALLAAGANCSKVILVESCAEYDNQGRMLRRAITLQNDVARVQDVITQTTGVEALLIDPISAYLGTKLDSNSNTAVRAVLADLQALAESERLAVALTSHYGKDSLKNAKTRVLGSTAFVAGVRSVIGVFRDPGDEKRLRRLFLPIKCNLVPESERTGLAFIIKSATVTDGDDIPIETAHVEWLPETITQTADEILRAENLQAKGNTEEDKQLSPERHSIIELLHEAGHPLTSKQIAEGVHGEEILEHSDPRRVKIRRLLGKMLADRQVEQLPDRTYTIPSGGNSGNSGNSGNRYHIESMEPVTAVTGYRLPSAVTGIGNRGTNDDREEGTL